jgi:N-acetylglutamate synthase-like GNAT family acetyltransferase
MAMKIDFLLHKPDALEILAPLLYQVWGYHQQDRTLAARYEMMRQRMNKTAVPTCVVASDDAGRILGTASLITCDCDQRSQYTPWLATVYVLESARHMGIGRELVARIENEASLLGIDQIYLVTPDRESFYAQLGWETIEHVNDHDRVSCLMKKKL